MDFFTTRKKPHTISLDSGRLRKREARGNNGTVQPPASALNSCNILYISVTYLLLFSGLKGRNMMPLYVFSQFSFTKVRQLTGAEFHVTSLLFLRAKGGFFVL